MDSPLAIMLMLEAGFKPETIGNVSRIPRNSPFLVDHLKLRALFISANGLLIPIPVKKSFSSQ